MDLLEEIKKEIGEGKEKNLINITRDVGINSDNSKDYKIHLINEEIGKEIEMDYFHLNNEIIKKFKFLLDDMTFSHEVNDFTIIKSLNLSLKDLEFLLNKSVLEFDLMMRIKIALKNKDKLSGDLVIYIDEDENGNPIMMKLNGLGLYNSFEDTCKEAKKFIKERFPNIGSNKELTITDSSLIDEGYLKKYETDMEYLKEYNKKVGLDILAKEKKKEINEEKVNVSLNR